MSTTVDPGIRAEYEASGGKLTCRYCGRTFLMKPANIACHIVFRHHNVARRHALNERLPPRCDGAGITVRVTTEEESDAQP